MKTAQITVAGKLLGPFQFPEVPRVGEIILFDLPDNPCDKKRVVVTAIEWLGRETVGEAIVRCEWERKKK